jgi:hypothetical protein
MTNSWNGFGNLDLSKVQELGSRRLAKGKYTVKCTNAEIVAAEGQKTRRLVCDFTDENGEGDIRHSFLLVHDSDKAVEIGMRQLKSFLIAAKHPNPDKPGDVATLKNLTCGIVVGEGKPWQDKEGAMRSSTEVKTFFTADGDAPTKSAPLNDAIPF